MTEKQMSYPYKGTEVSVDESQMNINTLLQKYGVKGVQWTNVWDKGEIELRFPIEFDVEGVKKGVAISLRPPLFYAEHRSYDPRKGYYKVKAPDYKAGMRALFFYIKAMLEAQRYGLDKIEEVFMSHIIVALQDGTTETMGDLVRKRIADGSLPQLSYEKNKEVT